MEEICEYCHIAGGYGDLIWETTYWMIYLAPSQLYLGTCVVALKRHCSNLAQLEQNEWIDFSKIVCMLELALEKLFQPTLYNWSCFKNSTFRGDNPHPEIHWHFIPRYKEKVEFEGIEFEDPDFGYIPQPIKHQIPLKIHEKMAEMIKKTIRMSKNEDK